MNNIVFINHEPFTKRQRELFYIEQFLATGFNIEVWDLSQYVFKGINVVDTLEDESYTVKIDSYNDLCSKMSIIDVRATVFVVECVDCWNTRKIYRLLSDYSCYMVRIDFYANTDLKEKFSDKLSRFLSPAFLVVLRGKVNSIATRLYKKIYSIKGFDRYLSSSSLVDRTDKINHPDYENYRFKEHIPILSYDYIVFCDNYFPYHPDFKYFHKYKKVPSDKEYQSILNHFFSFLEEKYKMPVVIAAHPKAKYQGHEFENRKIIKYQTDNLVINSSMVVLHASNSISYAILSDKPFIFITTNGYSQLCIYQQRLDILASSLRKKVYNVDIANYDDINPKPVDEKVKDFYVYTYLTSMDTLNIRNFDTIKRLIKQA